MKIRLLTILAAALCWPATATVAQGATVVIGRGSQGLHQAQSVPGRSLRNTVTRESVGTPPRYIYGQNAPSYGNVYGGTTIRGGQSITHNFGLPADYNNGTRYYHAYPSVNYHPPQILTRETITQTPQEEYDIYHGGNVIRTQRLHTDRKVEVFAYPSPLYNVYPSGAHVGASPNTGHYVPVNPPLPGLENGATYVFTENSVQTLSAEPSYMPGREPTVRMVDSRGLVQMVPSRLLYADYRAGSDDVRQAPPGFGWIPQRLD